MMDRLGAPCDGNSVVRGRGSTYGARVAIFMVMVRRVRQRAVASLLGLAPAR